MQNKSVLPLSADYVRTVRPFFTICKVCGAHVYAVAKEEFGEYELVLNVYVNPCATCLGFQNARMQELRMKAIVLTLLNLAANALLIFIFIAVYFAR